MVATTYNQVTPLHNHYLQDNHTSWASWGDAVSGITPAVFLPKMLKLNLKIGKQADNPECGTYYNWSKLFKIINVIKQNKGMTHDNQMQCENFIAAWIFFKSCGIIST